MAGIEEIKVPDIGDYKEVEIIEIAVKVGDVVEADASLITLETDKAAMDIPSPKAGRIQEMKVKVGDKVSKGSVIAILSAIGEAAAPVAAAPAPAPKSEAAPAPTPVAEVKTFPTEKTVTAPTKPASDHLAEGGDIYAGPAIRRYARELGVSLALLAGRGTGQKGRLLRTDIEKFVKESLQKLGNGEGGTGTALPKMPSIDFTPFGEVEVSPLSRIKKLSGVNLHRNWVVIPHVTQFDEADITTLEAFRVAEKATLEKEGVRLTPLVFVMKAVVAALKAFPNFNASLDPEGDKLYLKRYYHLGVAVDTPNGLVVPVIRDCDQKGMKALSMELAEISERARTGQLKAQDMQGSSFSISSLGGIGGTAFTPIINAPDVAILGVSKSFIKPVYEDNAFVPRLMLPLSLSYDHRVIDGAEAARFTRYLVAQLADIRRLLL